MGDETSCLVFYVNGKKVKLNFIVGRFSTFYAKGDGKNQINYELLEKFEKH